MVRGRSDPSMPWTERLGSAGSDQMDAGVHRLLPRLCSPILYYTPNISLRWQRCRPNRLIDWNASCPPVSPPRRCPRSRQTACLAAPVAWNTVDATEIVLDGGKCDRTRLDRALIRFSQSVLCGVLGIVNGHLLKIERQITSAAWRKASQKPVRCALSCRKRSSAVASVDLGVHFQAVVNACQDFLTRSPQRPRAGALERACVTLQVSADALAVTTQAHVHERTQAGAEELFTSLSSELEADVFHNAWPALRTSVRTRCNQKPRAAVRNAMALDAVEGSWRLNCPRAFYVSGICGGLSLPRSP